MIITDIEKTLGLSEIESKRLELSEKEKRQIKLAEYIKHLELEKIQEQTMNLDALNKQKCFYGQHFSDDFLRKI